MMIMTFMMMVTMMKQQYNYAYSIADDRWNTYDASLDPKYDYFAKRDG